MSDITTIEEVQAGNYTVRVGRDGDGYEAVVIDKTSGSTGNFSSSPLGMASFTVSTSTSNDDDDDEVLGPPATAPHKWVAVGFAIEAYEWRQVCEETADVEDAYSMFADNVNLSTDSNGTARVFGSDGPTATQFAGEFPLQPEDDDD